MQAERENSAAGMRCTGRRWEGDGLIHDYELDGITGQIVREPGCPTDLFAEGEYAGAVRADLPLSDAEAEMADVLRERRGEI